MRTCLAVAFVVFAGSGCSDAQTFEVTQRASYRLDAPPVVIGVGDIHAVPLDDDIGSDHEGGTDLTVSTHDGAPLAHDVSAHVGEPLSFEIDGRTWEVRIIAIDAHTLSDDKATLTVRARPS